MCPDPSFEFVTDSDVLKPVIGMSAANSLTKLKLIEKVDPYEPPSKAPLKNRSQRNQAARPTPVPNLDDVQPFMSVPDYVEKPGSELEALLSSKHIQNPHPYPGNLDVLPSYSAESPESACSQNLSEHTKHALNNCWKYDPIGCSVKAAFNDVQGLASRNHGLTKEESKWITSSKLTTLKRARSAARIDFEQPKKKYKWTKISDEDDDILSINGNSIDRELDDFYGPDGTDLRPIDNDSDEGFSEPNTITTTIVSLPDKSPLEEGVTTGRVFQDSGISMDQGYAEYSLAPSLPNTAREIPGMVPSDWPTFNAKVAPLRTRKQTGPWLALVGDQKQCEWPGRRQGPYDFHDLRLQRKSECESSEAATPSSGQEQPSTVHGNNEDRMSNMDAGIEAFVHAGRSFSECRSQHSPGFIGTGPPLPATHVDRVFPQNNIGAIADARRSVPSVAFTTPLNQCIRHVPVETTTTPATVEFNLTPERKSETEVSDASDGSLEVHLPSSPTTYTQKGQSALGRYVQETTLHRELARQNSSTMGVLGSDSDELSVDPPQERPSQPKGDADFRKGVEIHQKVSDAAFTLSPPKPSQDISSSAKIVPIPATPANRSDSAFSCPITPFQLDTPANAVLESPGTPTPAPKGSKAKGKSTKNIFKSPKLGSRSPERATPNSDIIVAPSTPAAAATDPHCGSSFGSQGLLFQMKKKNEKGTKNVLNSLKLSPERGARTSEAESMDESEDELAGGSGAEVSRGVGSAGKPAVMVRPRFNSGGSAGRIVAPAVVVPRVRRREQDEGVRSGDVRDQEPRKKKARRSMRKIGGEV